MQLTEDQVKHLFEFTQKKFVYWYDLQIELVDHLATHIEEEMNADASLSFEAALAKVYKGFGIFGFAKIAQEKSEQLRRMAKKMWWNEILAFITWPKIVLLALIFAFLWQLSSWFDANILMVIFLAAYIITGIVMMRYINRTAKTSKRLLLLQAGPTHFSSVIFMYQMLIIMGNFNFSTLKFCIYATIGILIKVASFQLYVKVKEKAMEQYPEAFQAET